MSISFDRPINTQQQAILNSLMEATSVAHDNKDFLYDGMSSINERRMAKLAKEVNQPVIVNLHAVGNRKTLSDGTTYEVTERGWVKVDN